MSDDNHGNTPAAWAAVVLGLVGFTVGGIGVMFTPMNQVLFYTGVGIVFLAGIVYLTMQRVGTGSTSH